MSKVDKEDILQQYKAARNNPEELEAETVPVTITLTVDDLRKIIRQEVSHGIQEAIQGIRVTLPFDPWGR